MKGLINLNHICKCNLVKNGSAQDCHICNGKGKDTTMQESEITDHNKKILDKFKWNTVE